MILIFFYSPSVYDPESWDQTLGKLLVIKHFTRAHVRVLDFTHNIPLTTSKLVKMQRIRHPPCSVHRVSSLQKHGEIIIINYAALHLFSKLTLEV